MRTQRVAVLLLVMLVLAACARDRAGETAFGAQRANAPAIPGAPVDILTTESGPHRVPFAQLRQIGLISDPAQLAELGMTHRGDPVPVMVDGDGTDAGLIFVAQAVQSEYTAVNVYRLQPDPAPLRPGQADTADDPSPSPLTQFTDRLILAENHRYSPLPQTGDHWFWAQIRSGRPHSLLLTLPDVADGPASLRLDLWSATGEAGIDPDHHVQVTVNGEPVMDSFWDGEGWQSMAGEIPAGLLVEGENRVEVSLPGDTGSLAESAFLDSLTLDYPRPFVAEAGRLAFTGPGGSVTIAGLGEDALLLDVTDPTAWRMATTTESGRRYVAVDPSALTAPVALLPVASQPILRDRPTGADYVVIGPPHLLDAATPLLDQRRAQGVTPLAVPVQRIYDEFNFGLAEPEAVRSFLAHAAESWSPAPRYVLLLGDATYDPRGYTTGPEANLLPSFWAYTVFGGQTVTDVDFARLDDDALPDVAVGRLPARTPDQVRTAVKKILAYEAGIGGGAAWRQQVLAVADGSEPSFQRDAQAFLDLLPSGYVGDLFAPAAGQADVGAETVDRVQSGDFVAAYFGHGSVTQWGKDQLLTVDNTAGLNNRDRLPILLNFTCLTGLFTHPTVDSLTETLLWQSDGGAIASLASTSLTLADSQSDLVSALADNLFADPPAGHPLRLGDAFLAAQRQLPTHSQNAQDVLNTFLLFGDPALVVRNQ